MQTSATSQGAKTAILRERLRGVLWRRHLPWLPPLVSKLDLWPTPLLVALGLIPALGLAWLASHSPLATAVLVMLIVVAARWQGQRLRVLWGRGIPEEVEEPPPLPRQPVVLETPEEPLEPPPEPPPPPPPQPLYPVQDPLIELMALPGGRFWMGSDQTLDPQAYDDEFPRREVRLRPFAIARTPVTRGLYRRLMPSAPSAWKGDKEDDNLPANILSWEDAVRFCNALSQQSGRTLCYQKSDSGWECDWQADGYRLPTEAEWEYACRAGSQTPWFWGAEEKDAAQYAWFSSNSGYRLQPVGTKAANSWGLYDMAGNVWEWCWDWFASYDPQELDNPRGPVAGKLRVLRGGSFTFEPRRLRSAARLRLEPERRVFSVGFRCVRGSGRQLGP